MYPTLPSQQIAIVVHEESEKLARLIKTGEPLNEALSELVDSIALDVGLPLSVGGDPGPVGAAPMLHCSLAEGMGDHLSCARVYARHQAAVTMLLKYGTSEQREAACLDAVAGLMTSFETGGTLTVDDDGSSISGVVVIGGAREKSLVNLVVAINDEQLILINKNISGITIEEELDDAFGNCRVIFDQVKLEEQMLVPNTGKDTEFMSQVGVMDDYYNLLISAAQLGMLKRSFASHLEIQSIKSLGAKRMIKHDLVQSHMARLQVPIYSLESIVYGVAGKWSWSNESLAAECLAVRSVANDSLELLQKMGEFSGHLFLREPWTLRQVHLRHLSRECSTSKCHRLIGIRGFQSHQAQLIGMEKRLSKALPMSREWRRIKMWQWNWSRRYPELVSFGYSTVMNITKWYQDTKNYTRHRMWYQTMTDNLRQRTKKDGCGTWASEDHDTNKLVRFSFEYAQRDYAKRVCEHGQWYGSTVPQQEFVCELMGKGAKHLFVWGQLLARHEKSHQSSVRGFELEKDLAMMGMNVEHEAVVLDIDLATSTWFDSTMEPHGRQ